MWHLHVLSRSVSNLWNTLQQIAMPLATDHLPSRRHRLPGRPGLPMCRQKNSKSVDCATESGPFDSDCIERLGLAYFNQTSFLPASLHSRTQGLFEGNKSTLNCMLLKFLHKYPLKLHCSPRNTCQCHLSGSGVPVDGVKLRRRRGRRPRGRWGAAAQAWKENCRHGILIWFVQTGFQCIFYIILYFIIYIFTMKYTLDVLCNCVL